MIFEQIEHSPAANQWKRFPKRALHGINIPVFSLRTEESAGIGEYLDLLPLIPWCKSVGMEVIQLLPLNDCGEDPSPYFALSSQALNPHYLSLSACPRYEQHASLVNMLSELQKTNDYSRIPYKQIYSGKLRWIEEYLKLEGGSLKKTPEFKRFLKDNSWVHGYAAFKVLRNLHGEMPVEDWPDEEQHPTADFIARLNETKREEVDRYMLTQFLCSEQMRQVKREADEHGVFLKGDIPILISRDSADVWQYPQLFSANSNAGCPPDLFSLSGQDWKFPTFKWDAMRKEDYRWWKERLRVASNFFHIYRLDHYVGFYRIWTVPRGASPGDGMFVPRDPDTWIEHGETIIRMMLDTTDMLPIGEDLGTVPRAVRKNMKKLGICSTKVMRWERSWKGDNEFLPIDEYPPLSMSTVGTHDNQSLREWWEQHPDEALDYCRQKGMKPTKYLKPDQHYEILRDSHRSASLFHINLLHEYLALFPDLSWPLPADDRLNVPGTENERNWSYKFRRDLKTITSHSGLAQLLRELANHSLSEQSAVPKDLTASPR